VIEEPDARVVLVLLEGHCWGRGAGSRGQRAGQSRVFFQGVRSQIWAMRVTRGSSPAGIEGTHSRARRRQTLTRERAGHVEPPLAVLAEQHANHALVLGVILVARRGGKRLADVVEGTRLRSARPGRARTSSTRRKWSTTERSTNGCTTTSSYCPRGLTTSTLATIETECLFTVIERSGRRLLRRSIAKKNVARFRENNAGADYAPPHSAKRACTRPRSIERYRRVHVVTLW
jgi:hypothetical protein